MSFILTCGHEVDNFEDRHEVCCKEYTREGNKALAYKVVCKQCYWGTDSFNTEEEAMEWLLNP